MVPEQYYPKVIGSLWDRGNLNAINYNFSAMSDFIAHVEKRIFDYTWEETKEVNTIEMLEPVQSIEDLPENPKPKSLITVLDNEKVYAFVRNEWQQFSEIDLDPFSPFKAELKQIIADYETKIKDITNEVTDTKDAAIQSIEGTQSQSEGNIKETEQNAVSAINKKHEATDNHMSEVEQDLKDKTSEFAIKFNEYITQLTDNKDVSLNEIEQAKQAALDAITNENQDNWQKYKLTQDNGSVKSLPSPDLSDNDLLDDIESGLYYVTTASGIPVGVSSYNGFLMVMEYKNTGVKRIEYKPYNSNQAFIKRYYNEWSDWDPTPGTKVELFSGNFSNVNSQLTLNDDPRKYSYLIFDLDHIGGPDVAFGRFWNDYYVMRLSNLGNNGNGATLIETSMKVDSSDPSKINVEGSVRVETDTASGKNYMPKIFKVTGVM